MSFCQTFLTSLLLVTAAGLAGAAQQELRLHSSVDLVALDIYVRDAKGTLVTDLEADDFVVLENGAPQQVSMLAASHDVPIDALLLVDQSSSMTGEKDVLARAAARAFASTLRPDDQLEVLGFSKRVRIVRPFEPLQRGLGLSRWGRPRGETALFDAMAVALQRFSRAEADAERRRVLLLLSDGDDTSSLLDEDAIRPALRRSGAVLYAVQMRVDPEQPVSWWLKQFAVESGGRALAVGLPERLPGWFRQVGEEIRSLYRLGYVSTDRRRNGEWRRISVAVPGVHGRVRTRTGYYAPSARRTAAAY